MRDELTDVERGMMKNWDGRVAKQDAKLENVNMLLEEIKEVG